MGRDAALGTYREAESRLRNATGTATAAQKKLLEAQARMAALTRRGGLGSTQRPAAQDVEAAAAGAAAASAEVRRASEERQRCERARQEAVAEIARSCPDLLDELQLGPAGTAAPSVANGAQVHGALGALPKTTIGLLFPGQGSQYVKMLEDLKDDPEVIKMVATATRVLGFDPLDACLNGPEDRLQETSVCQPCMFLAGMAGLHKLREVRQEAAERPGAVAGLSLGEYTALCAAGVFTFEEGMELVKVRSSAMAEAATVMPQAMLSVFGLGEDVLARLCNEQLQNGEVCQIANYLFPRGYSCAGTTPAISRLKDACEKAGALQAKVLKTSGGFHTELMRPAKVKLQEALNRLLPRMKPPVIDVYMNVTGMCVKAGTPPAKLVPLLAEQLCSPVLWEKVVRAMIRDGMTEFYEVGPMKQLRAMMKRIDQAMWDQTYNVEV